jgi:hypothetical protein
VVREMRLGAILLTTALLTLACGGSSPTAAQSPSPSAHASASDSTPTASPSAGPLTGAYGLLLSAGTLYLIRPDATEAAAVSVAAPSVQSCGQGMAAVLQPPVSASIDQVYFRDGDTKIRMVVPPASSADVTSVPGGPNTISFFSVSPDDQRIAVLVEDLSGPATISLRLYVEDLRGGGHHADIYTSTTPKGKGGVTLWPMGWHQGRLALALWAACTFEQVPYPSSWHLVDAVAANRVATIGDANCVPSVWPSPAGVACFDSAAGKVQVYDWAGKLASTLSTQLGATEVSPSGHVLAAGSGGGVGNPSPTTTIVGVDGSGSVTSPGHMSCLWIDDGHLLAPDAVIGYPSGAAIPLAQSGQCAGRFPGGL